MNDRQIDILARATPKRDYYCQSRRGNRLFDLGLGEIALAFTATSSKSDQTAITRILAEYGREGFVPAWLRERGVDWAVDLLPSLTSQVPMPPASDIEEQHAKDPSAGPAPLTQKETSP